MGEPVEVLAFPCNQFGGQESKCDDEIQRFARKITLSFSSRKKEEEFDVFAKVDVNGKNADPLFKFLRHRLSGTLCCINYNEIKWNFTIFICNKSGIPVKRFLPSTSSTHVEKVVMELLREDDAGRAKR